MVKHNNSEDNFPIKRRLKNIFKSTQRRNVELKCLHEQPNYFSCYSVSSIYWVTLWLRLMMRSSLIWNQSIYLNWSCRRRITSHQELKIQQQFRRRQQPKRLRLPLAEWPMETAKSTVGMKRSPTNSHGRPFSKWIGSPKVIHQHQTKAVTVEDLWLAIDGS